MAIYTIVAVTRSSRTLHPCWMLDATSAETALREAHALRTAGVMPWVPPSYFLLVRRASVLERRKFAELMLVRPVGGDITDKSDNARRAERLMTAFFHKQWLAKKSLSNGSPSQPNSTPSG